MESRSTAFYRGYLPDDCSLVPLTIALATIVAQWLLVSLVSAFGSQPTLQTGQPAAQLATATQALISPSWRFPAETWSGRTDRTTGLPLDGF
jgi:hypothetical protein